MTGFGRILEDLNAESVRFVIIGGIAVIRHGVVRATRDLDIVVARDDATETALTNLVVRWKATRPDGSPETRTLPTRGWALHLRTEHGLVDILADGDPPVDLPGLLDRSDERKVDGVAASICSLADLVALKRAAGRTTDLEDLARLETVHGELPRPPDAA